MEREPRRFFWWTETRFNQPGQELLALDDCRLHRTTVVPQTYGLDMINYQLWCIHLLAPDLPGCYNGPENFSVDFSAMLAPASSNHAGGAHSLLADGGSRFVNEQVDVVVWRALGTRNGGESVALSF